MRGEDYVILRERDIHAVAAPTGSRAAPASTSEPTVRERRGPPRTMTGHARRHARSPSPTSSSPRVTFNADGLVPAIVQEDGTGDGADDGLDERGVAAPHARDRAAPGSGAGRRQEYWCKGETSGDRQYVREALLRLRRRHPAVRGRAGGRRAPATPATVPASTGPSGPGPSRRTGVRAEPSRDEFHALAAELHGRARVARAAGRPHHPGGRLRPAVSGRRARLPARVGRARRALEPVVVRGARPAGHASWPRRTVEVDRRRCRPTVPPRPAGSWPRSRPLLARLPVAGRSTSCRRCTAAWSATSATTWSARSSACPTCPRRPRPSRRRAVGHRRAGRLRPLAPAGHADRERLIVRAGRRPTPSSTGPTTRRSSRLDAAGRRRGQAARRAAGRAARRPTTSCPRSRSPHGVGATTAGRSRWPRSTSWPATSSRSCCPSASTSTSTPTRSTSTGCCARSTRARTCTSCACPS